MLEILAHGSLVEADEVGVVLQEINVLLVAGWLNTEPSVALLVFHHIAHVEISALFVLAICDIRGSFRLVCQICRRHHVAIVAILFLHAFDGQFHIELLVAGQFLARGVADDPANIVVLEEVFVVLEFLAHLAHVEMTFLHVLLRIVVLGMVHVQFLILRAAGVDGLPQFAVP